VTQANLVSWKGRPWTRPRRSTPLYRRLNGFWKRLDHAARKKREGGRDRYGADRFAWARHRLGVGGSRADESSRYTSGISGKTTLTLHVIARPRKRAASAPSSTPSMRSIRSMRASSGSISRSFDLAARYRRAGARNHGYAGAFRRGRCFVIDSVAALTPRAEIEGEMGIANQVSRRGS